MKVVSMARKTQKKTLCSARKNKMKSIVWGLGQLPNDDPLVGLREPYRSFLQELLHDPQARDEFIKQLKMYDTHGQLLSHYKGTKHVAP